VRILAEKEEQRTEEREEGRGNEEWMGLEGRKRGERSAARDGNLILQPR